MLRWTLILRVLVVSLILWIPLFRFLPEVAGWRVDRRFGRLYVGLRDAERHLEAARDPGQLRAGLAALDRLSLEGQRWSTRLKNNACVSGGVEALGRGGSVLEALVGGE